jgi:hypothetical protein
METRVLKLESIEQATQAIEEIGASNSEFMATRAIQVNCRLSNVPAQKARAIKKVYNEVGAEAAISHDAFYDEGADSTDMIVMGTVAHHREARRVVENREDLKEITESINGAVEAAL